MRITDRIIKPKTIDKVIFVFMIIFFLSVNNSIFVNQIGYLIALLLIFYRYFKTGENQFPKTGLEPYFLVFIFLEFLSANVSQNRPVALENLVKRILQILILYTVIIAATDTKKTKLFVNIYMGAALATMLFYIGFAYRHFIKHLYVTETKGPSAFQYVMTAGGLMMFTFLFFLAFFMNKKEWNKEKYYYLFGSIISFVGVISSYTRAAWLGMFAGLIAILVMKKKWWLIGASVVLFAVFLFIDPEISKVTHFNYDNGKFTKLNEINTNGKAISISSDSTSYYVGDYQEGVKKFVAGKQTANVQLPNPVGRIDNINEKYLLAALVDTRVYILDKLNNLNIVDSLISPGRLVDYSVGNGLLYVCDKDSGLSVFYLNHSPRIIKRIPEIKNVVSCFAGSNYFAVYNMDNDFLIYSLKDSLPEKIIYCQKDTTDTAVFLGINSSLLFAKSKSMKLFEVKNDSVKFISENKEITGVAKFSLADDKIFAVDLSQNLYVIKAPLNNNIEVIGKVKLDFSPSSISAAKNDVYLTQVKYGRVKSMYDPNWITNIERINQIKTAFRIFMAHPILGIGDIGVEHEYSKHKNYYEKENFGHLHNNYTQFLVIYGIVGFIFMIFYLARIYRIHRQMYKLFQETDFISSYTIAALACFIAFLFTGLAEWNFGDQEIITVIWFTLGLNIAFYRDYLRTNTKHNE